MAETLRVLGQQNPSAGVLTDLYVVPVGQQCVVASVVVCNQSNSVPATFRLSVAIAGAADGPHQYLYRDCPLSPGESIVCSFAGTLGQTDVIRCRSDTANLSFNCFGSEVS